MSNDFQIPDSTKSALFNACNHLRVYLPADEFYFVLFIFHYLTQDDSIVFLENDKGRLNFSFFEKKYYKRQIKPDNNGVVKFVKDSDSENAKFFGYFESISDKIPFSVINYVINDLESIVEDEEQLNQNYIQIFEHLFDLINNYQGKGSGQYVQPKEITDLIIKLADLDSDARVYNPFAGMASYGINLEGNQEYFGQEISLSTWAIGKLRLLAHGKDQLITYEINTPISERKLIDSRNSFSSYTIDDSVYGWNENNKYDLIVSSPPFNMRILEFSLGKVPGVERMNDIESFLIVKAKSSLNIEGKLISVYPLSFLWASGRKAKFRKWLIDSDLIDSIIILPSGLFSNTNIPVCIIIFKIKTTKPGYVKFVDASSFYEIDDSKNKKLNHLEILNLIENDSENEFLKYVDKESIYQNDFDLSVKRYFLKEIDGVNLGSFSKILKGAKATINQKMKQVQIRDLKDNVFDSILNSDDLEYKLVERQTFRMIEESCLLIATRWNSLKPTYFIYSGEPIVISKAIVALKLREDRIDPLFLISEFSADYIQEQLNSYRVGSVQPMLRNKDLLNIVFQLPSMEVQNAKVSGIKDSSKRLRKLESEKENILNTQHNEQTGSSTSLSHVLGKPLLNIGSSIEIIQNALSNLKPEWRDYTINQKKQFTLADAFDSISKNVKYIQELVDNDVSLISVSKFELYELSFLKFLKEFKENQKKSLSENVDLELDIHEDVKEQMDNRVSVRGNSQKLRIVLLNLLDNAKKHAFIKKDHLYKFKIEIKPFTANEEEASGFNYDIDGRNSYIEVKVSNTGKPFPKDFKLEDYTRKNFSAGITANRGLGGYEVNEILKVHNDGKRALNIVSNTENSEYSSTVSFIMPII